MIKMEMVVDKSFFDRKMGNLGSKVWPYARIQAEYVAKQAQKAVRLFTMRPEGGGGGSKNARTTGRQKIADLWEMTRDRKAYMDIYTIKNLYPNQDVILYFEEGTKPHEIVPKRKRILFWEDPESGEDMFAKIVHHPGTVATKMIERTEREVIDPKTDLWVSQTLAMIDRETR